MPLRFPEISEESYQYPLIIKQILDSALTGARDQEIVYRDSVRMSYSEFGDRIGRLAAALATLGVEEGTTVAVMDWDSHRYLECYFAVPMMGAVLQTVNVRLSNEQIAYCLEHAKAEILVVHRDFLAMAQELIPKLPRIRHLVLMEDEAGGMIPKGVLEYQRLLDATGTRYIFIDVDENAIATTFYTTGTTGSPKAVFSTHRQIVVGVLAVLGGLAKQLPEGLSTRDVYMPMTPMFHVLAWSMPYVATLIGLKQVYPGRYDAIGLLDLRAREGVTYSHCVPTILQMILTAAEKRGDNLVGWKIAIGGAVMTHALCAAAHASGLIVMAGYGMSETGPGLLLSRSHITADSSEQVETLCKAGLPIPLVQLRVVDERMQDVMQDDQTVGEVVARAPWLTTAYVQDATASKELWRGGWLHTQDLATWGDDGYVQIVDRAKDVIKSGGEWISSLALERLLSTHRDIADVAIVGVADARWGERPVAVIVARDKRNRAIDLNSVHSHLEAHIRSGAISRFARPDTIFVVDSLPRTSVGKIDKKRLRGQISKLSMGGVS